MALDVPMRFEDQSLLWTVDDVYSPAECSAFIERIERASPTLATNNPLYRDQDRVVVDDHAIADDLFVRLRGQLPERIGALSLEGLNPRLRMRYRPVGTAGARARPSPSPDRSPQGMLRP